MTAPLTPAAAVERVKELDAKATPGPWDVSGGLHRMHVFAQGDDGHRFVAANCFTSHTFVTATSHERQQHNAAFIAESRTLLPVLAAAIERQAGEIERLTTERDDYARMCADPEMVHLNILRGGIAKPSRMNLLHLAGATNYDGLTERCKSAERDLAAMRKERDELRAALALVTEKFGNTIAWHDEQRSQPHDPYRECAWQMGEAFNEEDRDALAVARAALSSHRDKGARG